MEHAANQPPYGLRLPGNGFSIWLDGLSDEPSSELLDNEVRSSESTVLKGIFARLPGNGFTVWTHPEEAEELPESAVPGPRASLPGNGFSLWTQMGASLSTIELRLRPVKIRLPAAGFSVWTNGSRRLIPIVPSTSSDSSAAPAEASSGVGAIPSPIVGASPSSIVGSTPSRVVPVRPVPKSDEAPTLPVSLPGKGFSIWTNPSFETAVKAVALAASSRMTSKSKVRLLGKGFSIWTRPLERSASSSGRPVPVSLPGNAFTVWTYSPKGIVKKPATASDKVVAMTPIQSKTQPHYESTNNKTMKSFGFLKWVGFILILSLLLAYLDSEIAKRDLGKKYEEQTDVLEDTKEERTEYYDQLLAEKQVSANLTEVRVNLERDVATATEQIQALTAKGEDLAQQLAKAGEEIQSLNTSVADYKEKEASLTDRLARLEDAKDSLENSLKTQLANQEAAYAKLTEEKKQVDENLAALQANLEEVKKTSQAKETELSQQIAAKTQALAELEAAMNDVGTRLQTSEKTSAELKAANDQLRAELEALKQQQAEDNAARELEQAEQEQTTQALTEAREANEKLLSSMGESKKQLELFEQTVAQAQGRLADSTLPLFATSEQDVEKRLRQELKRKEEFSRFVQDLKLKVEKLQEELDTARNSSQATNS